MKLSHTKVSKYKECPARYDFYYNRKLRTTELGSPLWFGSALDDAFNRLLLEKKKALTDAEQKLMDKSAKDILIDKFTYTVFNNKKVCIPESDETVYSVADFDENVLTEHEFNIAKCQYSEVTEDLDLDSFRVFSSSFMEYYKTAREVTKNEKKLYLTLNWLSLHAKAHMLLEAYEKEVLPQIHEVISIQEKITLPNDDGDEIEGYIDFIATFIDDPSTPYIVDNKTASKAYKESDLTESEQLNLYAYYKDIAKVCYIVVEKNIRKRDPRVRITIMRGDANIKLADSILDNFENTLLNVKKGNFTQNFESGCFFFGKPCEYHDLCHKERMPKNIVKLK